MPLEAHTLQLLPSRISQQRSVALCSTSSSAWTLPEVRSRPVAVSALFFHRLTLLSVITPIHVSHITAHLKHQEHTQHGVKPTRHDEEVGKTHQSSYDDDGKAHIETFERT